MPKKGERNTRRSFQSARDVKPHRITGSERPADIIEGAVPGLRRPSGAHRVRAHAKRVAEKHAHLPHAVGRDDARRASPVVPHPAHRARPHRLHHHDGREPLPRRAPRHRSPHSRDRSRTPATCTYRLARIIRIYDLGLLGGDAARDRQALQRAPAEARLPEEDDHHRAALPARARHRRHRGGARREEPVAPLDRATATASRSSSARCKTARSSSTS